LSVEISQLSASAHAFCSFPHIEFGQLGAGGQHLFLRVSYSSLETFWIIFGAALQKHVQESSLSLRVNFEKNLCWQRCAHLGEMFIQKADASEHHTHLGLLFAEYSNEGYLNLSNVPFLVPLWANLSESGSYAMVFWRFRVRILGYVLELHILGCFQPCQRLCCVLLSRLLLSLFAFSFQTSKNSH